MQDSTRHIIRRIFTTLTAISLIAYWVFAGTYFKESADKTSCNKIDICITDSSEYQFIEKGIIEHCLLENNLYPLRKLVDNREVAKIEDYLNNMSLVRNAECFRAVNGDILIELNQRCPMFHIMTADKEYYIDKERKVMPTSTNFTAWLPIVTGTLSEDFAKGELYDFIDYIQSNEYWTEQIDQIEINKKQHITLSTRTGVRKIILGDITHYEKKLKKLILLREQYPNESLGNKYQSLNLSYNDLIFCSKN